jgi:hypothetical protein
MDTIGASRTVVVSGDGHRNRLTSVLMHWGGWDRDRAGAVVDQVSGTAAGIVLHVPAHLLSDLERDLRATGYDLRRLDPLWSPPPADPEVGHAAFATTLLAALAKGLALFVLFVTALLLLLLPGP